MAPMKSNATAASAVNPTTTTTTTANATLKRSPRALPAVLVIDPDASLAARVNDLATTLACRVLATRTLREAKSLLAANRVDVLLTDTRLPDGDALALLPLLRKKHPSATAVVTADAPSADDLIAAMHAGASDFLPKTAPKSQLTASLKRALAKSTAAAKVDRRIDRLTAAVKRLSEARRTIGQKVDLLCNDLVAAYGQISKQMDQVRLQEDFRKCLADAKDLEQLLCHAMDWVMRHLGYANFAVFLAAGDDDAGNPSFELGAYVKYTLPSSPEMTAAMRQGILPMTAKHGTVHLAAAEARNHLTPAELAHLPSQTLLSTTCAYLGETLATVVLFRDDHAPFTPDDVATLQAIAPLFATALSAAVHSRAASDDDSTADDHTPDSTAPDDNADWWKTGGESPY